MSRNASGTYTAPANSWNPAVEGSAIDEADWNATLGDIEDALTDSLDRTGKGKITAHIDFDENASPGTPASNVGRIYVADDGGVTTLYFKDSAGNVYNLNLSSSSGLPFTFNSTTTTNADPGTGKSAFNSATLASATEMAISTTTSGGADIAAYMATWDDTGTSDRGKLLVQKRTDASKLYVYTISGANVDGSGYKRITLTYVAGSGSISNTDPLAVTFLPPGSAGAAGAAGLDWEGAWQTATAYVLNDGVSNGGSSYICTQAHTSGASTEPGVGASWASYWDVFAAKGSDGLGTGDVTAASAFATDNVIIRSDGTSKGVQASAVTLDDSGNLSGVGTLATSGAVIVGTTPSTAPKIDPSGFIEYPEISAPSTPSSGFVRVYAKSDNKLYQKDDGGTETDLSAAGGGSAAAIIPQNVGLAVSAAASALTISLKGSDGNDPSGSNIVYLPFRSATGTTGTETTVQVTAATSLTISSGSTLGVTSSTAFRIWVVAFNDAGTIRLGAVNCVTMTSSRPTAIFGLIDDSLGSSTAEGGAGAADSSGVIYTGTAVTSKAYRVLGYIEWNTSGVTAGTWTTTNLATVQVWSAGIPLPGMPTGNRAAVVKTDTFSSSTASAFTDITGFSVAITPASAANLVRAIGSWNNIADGSNVAASRLVRGSTALAVGDAASTRTQATSTIFRTSDNISVNHNAVEYIDNPQSASSTTYKVQFWLQGGNYYLNRSILDTDIAASVRLSSTLAVEEIMG